MSNNRLEANEDESNKVDRPESNRQPIDNEQQVRRRPVTIIKKSSSSAIYESLKDYSYVKKVRPVSGYLMEENSNMIQNFYHSKRVDQNIYQTIVNESQNESKIYVDEIQKDSLYSKIDPNKLIRKEPLAFTDLRQPSYNEAIVNKSYSQLNSPAKLSTITDISSKQEEHETSDTSPYIVSSSGVISTTDEINYNESENEQDYRVSSIIPKIDNIPDSPKSIVLIF
jgi:hydroxymethylpyrimidine pyrophosphatase-like HAD family hydrolase